MKFKFLSLLLSSLCFFSSFWFVQNLFLPFTILAIETCPPGENRYRPGGDCEKESPLQSHNKVNDYPLSCIPASNLTYKQVTTNLSEVPNQVTVTLNVDLTEAELGGFGPNAEEIRSTAPDSLARAYPFNSLFDKPPNTSPFNERESFRTYWRLLSNLQQANAKAQYLNKVSKLFPKINNQTYTFYNAQDIEKEWTVKQLNSKLPSCLKDYPVCKDFVKKYQNLNQDTRDAYDALMPFNFDNLQAFLVLGQSVVTENIPYLNAINDGLNNPQTGIIYTLSPSWTQNQTNSQITMLKATGVDFQQLISKAKNFNCPSIPQNKLTHLPAPKTFPTPTALTQQVTFNDLNVEKKQVGNSSKCTGASYCAGLDKTTCNTYTSCNWSTIQEFEYTITGQGEGDPIVIFNHPFVENIKNSIISGGNSLYKMLLPSFTTAPDERTIDAPKSTFTASSPHPNSSVTVTTSNNSTDMPIYRETALIKDSLCNLKSHWLIPQGLQRTGSCDELPIPTITPPVCSAKQHLFETTCGLACYQEILDKTLSTSSCNGQVLNPYYAIAIALNENGGLVSGNPTATSAKHFGCDPFGAAGVAETIEGKLACMINTLRNKCQAGLSQEENLTSYGYQPGNNLENLISLLEGPLSPQLFISPSQATLNAGNLSTLLPSQQSFWYYYYAGYIDNYCTTHP